MTDPTTYHRPLHNAFPTSSLYEDDINPSTLTKDYVRGPILWPSLKSVKTKVAEVEEFKQRIPVTQDVLKADEDMLEEAERMLEEVEKFPAFGEREERVDVEKSAKEEDVVVADRVEQECEEGGEKSGEETDVTVGAKEVTGEQERAEGGDVEEVNERTGDKRDVQQPEKKGRENGRFSKITEALLHPVRFLNGLRRSKKTSDNV